MAKWGEAKLTEEEKKAKEEEKQRIQAEQERQRFNRQINYLVMRKMWQTIRHRAKKGSHGQTIYDVFHLSRERYTRIIRGQNIRLSENELRRLVAETGVRKEIFEGKDHFRFEAITEKDWQRLFHLRNMDDIEERVKGEKGEDEGKKRIKSERKKRLEDIRNYEKNLYEQMKQSDIDLLKNPDLYYFAVYLKSGKPATNTDMETDLREKVQLLNSVSLIQLERCGLTVLQEYFQVLEKQIDITGTLLRYMKLKQQEK